MSPTLEKKSAIIAYLGDNRRIEIASRAVRYTCGKDSMNAFFIPIEF